MAWTKEKQDLYWKQNKDKYNAKLREKYRNDREFRERSLKRKAEWSKANPQKAQEYRNRYWSHVGNAPLKWRFRIMLRDNFICTYCGRRPPEAILEIDHIHPESKGGMSASENYTTSCRECNRGKSNLLLK